MQSTKAAERTLLTANLAARRRHGVCTIRSGEGPKRSYVRLSHTLLSLRAGASRPLPARDRLRPVGQRHMGEDELGAQRQRQRADQRNRGSEIELAAEHFVLRIDHTP